MTATHQISPESILIVRLGAMGDVLHAMPAVAALRAAFPKARIGWAIERRWADLLQSSDTGAQATVSGRPLVDAIHVVDTRAWRKELFSASTWYGIRRTVGRLRGERYSVAIDVQGAFKSAVVAKASGAQRLFGFASPREQIATMLYGQKVPTRSAHVIDQNLELCSAAAGQSLTPGEFDLPHSARAEAWCDKTLNEFGISKLAILNPGAGWGAKCWPAERFGEVAKRLHERGIQSLINFAPNEKELADSVAEYSGGAAKPVACSLIELLALTRRASLFIGGDTGPLHLAAALNVPTVALFGPTDPARNGPYGTRSVILRSAKSVTSYSHVADADPGLQSITTDEVMQAAEYLEGESVGG